LAHNGQTNKTNIGPKIKFLFSKLIERITLTLLYYLQSLLNVVFLHKNKSEIYVAKMQARIDDAKKE
jgi:hypothetical protein